MTGRYFHDTDLDASANETTENGMKYSAKRAVFNVMAKKTRVARAKASDVISLRRFRHERTKLENIIATQARSHCDHWLNVKGSNSKPSSKPFLPPHAF